MLLELIAATARGLLARYPFDSAEDMRSRWHQLALYLSAVEETLP